MELIFLSAVFQTQQERSNKEKERRLQQVKEIKKKEKALVQEGKTPFYLKKCKLMKFTSSLTLYNRIFSYENLGTSRNEDAIHNLE
jgi:hypothetical protein